MLIYYFNLALRSFKRHRVLTALMVLAIALGIGASMTTLTVFSVLSGDPLPGSSHTLFHPQIEPRPLNPDGPEPPTQLTRYDAETLLREARGDRQALMTGGGVAIEPERPGMDPFRIQARYTSTDFFAMFNVPFRHGGGWDAAADERRARVVVITRELNDRVFGGGDSVGRTLHVDRASFTVVGVLDQWRPVPKFYDVQMDTFGEAEQVFLPFSTSRDLHMDRVGSMNCFAILDEGMRDTAQGADCLWMQYWVQLDSADKVADYERYLVNYSEQQRAAGRFEQAPNVRLHSLMAWLDYNGVVPGDVRLQLWLAFGFLLVCLLNTVGLLLAKFLRRSGEIGVRRALGASRREIFIQFLVEAGTVGLAGGTLGLGLAALGLWAVRQQAASYAGLAHFSPAMLLLTFVLALIASLLAGLLPAWRAMQITPAIQLKSQ